MALPSARLAAVLERLRSNSCDAHESLAGCELQAPEAEALAAALPHAPSLTSLDLSGNALGPAGAAALAAALRAPGCGLRRLDVSDCVLLGRYLSDKGQAYDPADGGAPPDAAGAAALLVAAGGARLERLDLSHSHLGADGPELAAALAAAAWPGLTLALGFCKLQADGLAPLLAALRRRCAAPGEPALSAALAGLELRNNNLRPAGAAVAAQALAVGADGMALAVTRLCLMNNHLLAEGGADVAAALAPDAAGRCNPWLQSLDVSSNCLGAVGSGAFAAAVAGNATLTSLSLHRNNAADGGTAALAGALAAPGCVLRALRLSNCHVHEPGAAAMADALQANTSLRWLDLCRNGFGQQAQEQLRAASQQAPPPPDAHGGGEWRELLLGDGPV